MTRVKICGLTNLKDARHAMDCGADELGFNFFKGSKRYVSPDHARSIVDDLPIHSGNVGVFVNETIESVLETAEYVGLDGVQLHGDEDVAYVRELRGCTKRFVIKAFSITPTFSVIDAVDWPVDYQLFDTYSPGERGGTGLTSDWKNFATDVYLWLPHSVYLAGGLTPENVAEAVRTVQLLHSVDVASGVESSPGKKDHEKVRRFIEAVRNAE